MMKLEEFNKLPIDEAVIMLSSCCSSQRWQEEVIKGRPYRDKEDFFFKQEKIWNELEQADYMQAFEGHAKIGDVTSLKKKYGHTKELAAGEQSGVDLATEKVIEELARFNQDYEDRFGYIFIVCATGKSATEMLEILKMRINNNPDFELPIAVAEQNKITKIRLEKIL